MSRLEKASQTNELIPFNTFQFKVTNDFFISSLYLVLSIIYIVKTLETEVMF